MTKTVISESHDPRFQMLGASRYYIQGCAGDEYYLCQNHDGCSCNFSLDAFSTDESSQAQCKDCPLGKFVAEGSLEVVRGADVPLEALATDAGSRHAAEEAFFGLAGVVAIEVAGGHALEHVDLNEHGFSFG